MIPRVPRIKSLYPIYRVDDQELRIGAEPHITARVDDTDGIMSTLIEALDGHKTTEELICIMQARFPGATEADVLEGIQTLIDLNFIEDAEHVPTQLTDHELERHSRNIKYFEHFANPEISKYVYQERLKNAKVCVLGLGGHGSAIMFQLASLGVGHLVAVDFDIFELSNLNRLTWFSTHDLGKQKTEVITKRLAEYAPEIRVDTFIARVGNDVAQYAQGCDLIICCIDQPYAQIDRWVNEAALTLGIPCIFSAHFTMTGRYYSIQPGISGCIDCMLGKFLREDPNFENQFWALARDGRVRNAHQAVIGPNVSVLAGMIAAEAIRYLAETQPPLSTGKMMIVDFGVMTGQEFFNWPRYADCPSCGNGRKEDWSFFGELEEFSRPWLNTPPIIPEAVSR